MPRNENIDISTQLGFGKRKIFPDKKDCAGKNANFIVFTEDVDIKITEFELFYCFAGKNKFFKNFLVLTGLIRYVFFLLKFCYNKNEYCKNEIFIIEHYNDSTVKSLQCILILNY